MLTQSNPSHFAICLPGGRGRPSIVGDGPTRAGAWADAALPTNLRREAWVVEFTREAWNTDPDIARMRRGD